MSSSGPNGPYALHPLTYGRAVIQTLPIARPGLL
jgi:hypothetical protein